MARLNTSITRLFNIRHPIIQGGMHYVGYAPLAAAVANAGGLGLVTALTQPTPAELKAELEKAQALLAPDCTGALGVNLTILPMFKEVNYDEYVRVIIDAGVKAIETAGRPPGDYVQAFKDAGASIIHKCVTTRHAKSAQKMGADAISLDGFECAGHPGEEDIGNWILQAQGARDLAVPYVASGGVGNGRQLAAALALGAAGVNMGTRFMATAEAPIHDKIKQALVDGGVGSTRLVMRSVRNTERVYKNATADEVAAIEAELNEDPSHSMMLWPGEGAQTVEEFVGALPAESPWRRARGQPDDSQSVDRSTWPTLRVVVLDAVYRHARNMFRHLRKLRGPDSVVQHVALHPKTLSVYSRAQHGYAQASATSVAQSADPAALRICTVEAFALLLSELGEPEERTRPLIDAVVVNNHALGGPTG